MSRISMVGRLAWIWASKLQPPVVVAAVKRASPKLKPLGQVISYTKASPLANGNLSAPKAGAE
ncbi:hypothetical protein D3C83_256180 [compost metagenome]